MAWLPEVSIPLSDFRGCRGNHGNEAPDIRTNKQWAAPMNHCSKKIHMIGIGGAGMSPIAELLHHCGHVVTGSDRVKSALTNRLERLGIRVQYDHIPNLVKEAQIVVYSSAVSETNDERVFAYAQGMQQIRRAELLGDLMRSYTTVCVCGTHGKTTTTSLIGTILHEAQLEPTVLVGGTLSSTQSPLLIGNSRIMVAEADEYDRSFLVMYPTVAVITNIDADHLDCYTDIQAIKTAFKAFTERLPFYGLVVACSDDANVRDVISQVKATVITYGIDGDADYRACNITYNHGLPRFTVWHQGKELGAVALAVPGLHNIRNALAAVAISREEGVDFARIAESLKNFKGVRRRFEIVGRVHGITVVDDYAHHPREIQATLEAARAGDYARIIAVFQPHLYSRTRDFLKEFAAALAPADKVVVTSIYKSREEPIPGVSSAALCEEIRACGTNDLSYVEDYTAIPEFLQHQLREGDLVLFMGAGTINESAFRLVEVLRG